ncbi:acetylornithine deacetylase [Spirochaeta africana]|uniref:Acetylornithine deacetylase ArgE n=1 Tax=Spirochaeta africana (strain ATCC 700263 / DSM 8902 / Z-7692) TaxID=889378 RepID=H9UKQ8_SPIAZ|nr:acetylornithine deacetylase [Spirochaeta africana]AFG38101.1 acetylornithine deacetylase ArgE [Spirochaeta africana DSM 8902]
MNRHRDLLLTVLSRLIAFPTVSDQSNLDLVSYVRELCEPHAALIHQVDDPDEPKASLLVRFGPDAPGGILLSGHTDVVPADPEGWQSDPFRLEQRGDRLYGRGTADMKGFIAAVLAAILESPSSAAPGAQLQRPVYLALTYDEEVGCLAAPPLIESFRDRIAPLSAVLVGEPSGMQPVVANKGISEYITEFHGRSAHSSKPQLGINAIELAHHYAARILQLAADFRTTGQQNSCDPPYTTIQLGTIAGGSATNVVPDYCRLSCDLRSFHDSDRQFFETEMAAVRQQLLQQYNLDPAAITTSITCNVPPLEPRPDSTAIRLAQELTGETRLNRVPYATEAGQYQQAGYEAVILGPGSIEQAHQRDEWISLAQLDSCQAMLQRLLALQSRPD